MRRCFINLAVIGLLIISIPDLLAEEDKDSDKATWEIGFGVGALNIADYLGSDEESAYVVPLPYFVYNSKHIKADRKGVRGVLWRYQDFELDISSKISLPVDSDDNQARQGMPDLAPLFEVGPALNYKIFSSSNEVNNISFLFPIRSVQAFDDWKVRSQGWVINPSIDYNYHSDEWKFGVKIGVELASSRFQQYFYDVKQEYVNDTRSFYQAKSGQTAYKLTTTMSRRFKNWYLGAFIEYNDLHDAENINSPLIKSKTNINSGFLIAWVFKQNKS